MGKLIPDAVLDSMLDVIANGVDRIDICKDTPVDYSTATTAGTHSLGSIAVTAGDGNGDWTIANGDTNGRKLTLAQQTGVSITNSGTASHIAGTDGSSVFYFATTCTGQSVTSGNTATINTFDIELSDAS
jgi:hypothetical protein